MAATNQKLTEILRGRTINGTSHSGDITGISFTDGSKLTIRNAPSNSNSGSTGGSIVEVRQSAEPPVLYLDMNQGSTMEAPLAGATASVVLKNRVGEVEYAD